MSSSEPVSGLDTKLGGLAASTWPMLGRSQALGRGRAQHFVKKYLILRGRCGPSIGGAGAHWLSSPTNDRARAPQGLSGGPLGGGGCRRRTVTAPAAAAASCAWWLLGTRETRAGWRGLCGMQSLRRVSQGGRRRPRGGLHLVAQAAQRSRRSRHSGVLSQPPVPHPLVGRVAATQAASWPARLGKRLGATKGQAGD